MSRVVSVTPRCKICASGKVRGVNALKSALRGHAADRGGETALGQLLKEALQGGASHVSMALLELLAARLDIDTEKAVSAAPACGCNGGYGELEWGDGDGTEADFATMSFLYTDGGDSGEQPSDDVDGDGKPDEPIPVTGKRPNDEDEDDDGGWLPPPGGGGDGGDDSGGDGPGGGEVIAEETPCVDQKPAGTDLGKLNDLAKLTRSNWGIFRMIQVGNGVH